MPLISFYDPVTLAVVVGGLAAGGALLEGAGQAADANSQADNFKQQAALNKLQKEREFEELKREDDAKLSRQRAVLAATGADLSFGTAGEILATSEQLAAKQQTRLLQDFSFQNKVLKANATTAKRKAKSAIFGSVLNAGVSGATAFSGAGGKFGEP